jgi:alkylation response protein AidB-like acyl-CoA dehydrogenase
VFIPLDWIIGGTNMAGQGWRMLMESLSIGRSISLPALSTACCKMAFRVTGAYSKIRKQFNTSISSFEGVEEGLGYIAGYTYMLEACRIMTAGAIDQNINPSIVSAIAKYHMTEMCRHVVSHSMDIHAGQMIQAGPRNILANAYLALPISITVEGANILTRNLIIFGQGAIRCHPYILQEIELITSPKTSVKELDKVLMAHIGFFAGNFLRTLAYGLTGGLFIYFPSKNKKIVKCKQQLTRMSTALALLADTSLILLGGSLKRRERVSARLGDILSHLYIASTVLKYYYDNGNPVADMDYVQWSIDECLYKIQIACNELLNNYPYRIIGKILKWVIFPYGTAYKRPSDKRHEYIVEQMLSPSEFRDRLTKYAYLSHQDDDLVTRLDKALSEITTVDPLLKKMQKGLHNSHVIPSFEFSKRIQLAEQMGILNADEAKTLSEFDKLRNEIIKVNEFSFDLNTVIA